MRRKVVLITFCFCISQITIAQKKIKLTKLNSSKIVVIEEEQWIKFRSIEDHKWRIGRIQHIDDSLVEVKVKFKKGRRFFLRLRKLRYSDFESLGRFRNYGTSLQKIYLVAGVLLIGNGLEGSGNPALLVVAGTLSLELFLISKKRNKPKNLSEWNLQIIN
jgi:hypothetical protein